MAKYDKLDAILRHSSMTDNEWRTFAELLEMKGLMEYVPEKRRLVVNEEIRHLYGHTMFNVFRDEYSPDYSEILVEVAKKLKVEAIPEIRNESDHRIDELENKIIVRVIEIVKEEIIKESGEKGWENWQKEWEKSMDENLKSGNISQANYDDYIKLRGLGVGAAIIAGKMAGFGLFVVANQAFFAISRFFGLGIGVAVAGPIIGKGLAALMGPIGWGIAGGIMINDLGDTNWKKVIPTILFVISLRKRRMTQFLSSPKLKSDGGM